MPRRLLECATTCLGLQGLLASPALADDISYRLLDMGTPGCQLEVFPWDINIFGAITGTSGPLECDAGHAFIWRNGDFEDISPYYEPLFSSAIGISDDEVVFGSSSYPDLAVVYRKYEAFPAAVPAGCSNNWIPSSLSSDGNIGVGSCEPVGDQVIEAAVYFISDNSSMSLGWFPENSFLAQGWACGVNNSGVVVGGILDSGSTVGYYWIDGVKVPIENSVGGTYFYPTAINNHNYIVGAADDAFGIVWAASYDLTAGEMRNLGDGGFQDVNDRQVGVGQDIVNGFGHAIAYYDDVYVDLHVFLPPIFDSSIAYAVNNYGWIIIQAEDIPTNRKRGFLLIPIYSKGDYDGDADVDLHDFGHFQECYAAEPYQGPEGGLHVGCSVFDFDDDADLDLTDYTAFQAAFTGAVTSGW